MIALAGREDIPRLRQIWQTCFPDADNTYLDFYFTQGFSQFTTLVTRLDGDIASMLTVIPALLHAGKELKKTAYIYAVATPPEYQKRGLSSALMNEADDYLRQQDYVAATLFPAEPSLYQFYERLGYSADFSVRKVAGEAEKVPSLFTLQDCSREQFVSLRQHWLEQRGSAFDYPPAVLGYIYDEAKLIGGHFHLLDTRAGQCYVLCYKIKDTLHIKETNMEASMLTEVAPNLAAACGCSFYSAILPAEGREGERHGMLKWYEQPVVWDKPPYMNLILD